MEEYDKIPDWVKYDEKKKIDILHYLNFFDYNDRDIFLAMIDYTQKNNTSYIPIPGIFNYIKEFGLHIQNSSLKNETTISSVVNKLCHALYKYNYCKIDIKDNKIIGIIMINPDAISDEKVQQLIDNIIKDYDDMDKDENKPFPFAEGLHLAGLPDNIPKIDIKELTPEKAQELSKSGSIIKLVLPMTGAIFIPTDKIAGLFEKSFLRIRRYIINSKEFAAQILMKMKHQYPSMIDFNSPEDLVRNVERSPQFYATLSNEILLNLNPEGTNQVIVQATEIIKALSVIQSEQEQKKIVIDKIIDILLNAMESHAIFFDKKNLSAIRERNQLLKVYPEKDYFDIVDKFLLNYSIPQLDGSQIIIPVKIQDETFYIHQKHFYAYFITRIDTISYQTRQELINRLNQDPSRFLNEPFMKSKDAFSKFIENNFPIKDIIIGYILKNPVFLYSQLVFQASHDIQIAPQIRRFFMVDDIKISSTPPLKPLCDILKLDYIVFLEDAKSRIPFKLNISILKTIMDLLKFLGKYFKDNKIRKTVKKKDNLKVKNSKNIDSNKPEEGIQEENIGSIIINMKEFKNSLIGDKDIYEMMNYYENRWNMALSKENRKQNLKIVHEKISKRMRSIRLPSADTIKKEAEDMVLTDDILKVIKDRESIIKYIILYLTAYYLNLEQR